MSVVGKSLERMISLRNRLHENEVARPELTAANSFLAFSIYTNHQISCMGDGACLLCVFVDTFVCVTGCRHLHLCRGSGDGSGVCVCVCVCVRVCV